MLEISVLSSPYVVLPVTAEQAGTAYNPTSNAVSMAFMAEGVNPGVNDWVAASWESTGTTTYNALCQIGPSGSKTLTVGVYVVWIKVTSTPEVPVFKAGMISIV